MRVRHKKWAQPYIQDHPELIVTDPEKWLGKWNQRFENVQPLALEIGIGKGQFIVEMAKKYPEINFLGVEIQSSVIAVALKKVVESGVKNVQLIHSDGAMVDSIIQEHEISHLYLNFSDPWPKVRHEKRRLTSPQFLDSYQKVLKPGSPLQFKTDNRGLFEYSVVTFNNYGLHFEELSLDLHNSEAAADNVETEYEQKFSQKGPIYKIVVTFPEANAD